MIQHYLLSSHGAMCTCKLESTSAMETMLLPCNVAVIMNCSNSGILSAVDFDAPLWQFGTNKDIFDTFNKSPCDTAKLQQYYEALMDINFKRTNSKGNEYGNSYCVFLGKCPNITLEDDSENVFRTGMYQLPVKVVVKKGDKKAIIPSKAFKDWSKRPTVRCFLSPKNYSCDSTTFDVEPVQRDGFISRCLPNNEIGCMLSKLTLKDVLQSLVVFYNMKVREDVELSPNADETERKQANDSFYNHFHIIIVAACTSCAKGTKTKENVAKMSLDRGIHAIFSKACPKWLRQMIGKNFVVQEGGDTYFIDENKERYKVFMQNGRLHYKKGQCLYLLNA